MLLENWLTYKHELVKQDAINIYMPANPISKMRSFLCKDAGLYRLSRRTCSLYSVEIKTCGSWDRLVLFNDRYDIKDDWERCVLFCQPSAFTGSFLIEGCAWDGLYLWTAGVGADVVLTVNYREPDERCV